VPPLPLAENGLSAATAAATVTPPHPPYRKLKLALHRTRQSWRVHYNSLYRLHFPRRAALLLHRAVIRTAAHLADNTATADAPPRILYYSRADPSLGHLVVKGERNLIDALRAKFGAALAVYRERHQLDGQRLLEAARTFGAATAIVAPHGVGLANIIYCE
jgi:capsular polysaccharide biosynthesis protein